MDSLASLGRTQVGIAAILAGSACSMFSMILGKVVRDWAWPYWQMSVGSNMLLAVLFATVAWVRGDALPEAQHRKWVLLRALCGSVNFLSKVLAVQFSGAPGDVSALTTINVVVAACLGHIFLAERLRPVHMVLLMVSITGAVLVAQPSFLFGGAQTNVAGLMLALLSGFANALSLIFGRKCRGVSPMVVASTIALVCMPFVVLLPICVIAEPSIDRVLQEPLLSMGFLGLIVLPGALSIPASVLGSMLCPAAVSATVFTSSSMILGYSAQTLLFGASPNATTLMGAAMMFLAVAAMACTRLPQSTSSPATSAPTLATSPAAEEASEATSVPGDDDEVESLASFMAAEYAEETGHEALRKRSVACPSAQTIGAVAAVVAVSV